MTSARRLYLAAMSNGDVGLGVLFERRLDTIRLKPRTGQPLTEQIKSLLEGIFPDEVVVTIAGWNKKNDKLANSAVYSVALALRRPKTRIAEAINVQDLETDFQCCRHLFGRCGHYTIETIHRLHSAYQCALRHDLTFGKAMPFDDDAMFARMTLVADENGSLRRTVEAYEIALAECEAAGVDYQQ